VNKEEWPWQNPPVLGAILMKNVMGYAVMRDEHR